MIITKKRLPRRTFLRGLGVTVGLPLLDGMIPALATAADVVARPVTRMSFMYVPNGIMNLRHEWSPATVGALEITPILEPLTAFRDHLLVLSGLSHPEGHPQPREVFENLFGDSNSTDPKVRLARIRSERSILDSLFQDASGILRGLGSSDRTKVTEYLDAIRDVERRIQLAEEQSSRDLPVVERPMGGIPATFEEHAKLMLDLQALAFQTDMTRVATFMLGHETTTRSYPELGI